MQSNAVTSMHAHIVDDFVRHLVPTCMHACRWGGIADADDTVSCGRIIHVFVRHYRDVGNCKVQVRCEGAMSDAQNIFACVCVCVCVCVCTLSQVS